VTNEGSNTVSAIDTVTNAVMTTFQVGGVPLNRSFARRRIACVSIFDARCSPVEYRFKRDGAIGAERMNLQGIASTLK
jgi:YVTN family beta-propeller protein